MLKALASSVALTEGEDPEAPEFERMILLEKVAASCSAARMSSARVSTQVPGPGMEL